MRKNFGAHPWIYPLPVFIIGTYDKSHSANAMVLTWGGIYNDKNLHLYLSNDHVTTTNILERKEFTISMADYDHIASCDYVGTISAKKDEKKLETAGFHTHKSLLIDAPIIDELSMTLECRMVSYDSNSCHLIAEILNVNADESILTDGNIDPAKLHPITFDTIHNTYIELGTKVGDIYKTGQTLKK